MVKLGHMKDSKNCNHFDFGSKFMYQNMRFFKKIAHKIVVKKRQLKF